MLLKLAYCSIFIGARKPLFCRWTSTVSSKTGKAANQFLQGDRITFTPNCYKSHVNSIEVYVWASQEKQGHCFSFISSPLLCCPRLTPWCLELDVLKQTCFFLQRFPSTQYMIPHSSSNQRVAFLFRQM